MQLQTKTDRTQAIVALSGLALVGQLEAEIDKIHAAESGEPDELVFDFADVSFTEPTTLQYVISLTLARARRGRTTKLRLPAGEAGARVRDFLRRWRFPGAFSAVTGIRFFDFVDPLDHHYFRGLGGDRRPTRYSDATGDAEGVSESSTDAPRFFPFTTWKLTDYLESARISDEALDTWSDELVLSVLDRHLQPVNGGSELASSGVYVASRIVFEAMTNAIRHPGANFIQSSSVLRTPRAAAAVASSRTPQKSAADAAMSTQPDEHFTVTFWDDGTSMGKTLQAAILDGRSVRHEYPAALDTRYWLTLVQAESEVSHDSHLIDSRAELDRGTPAHIALLATIFPGVTSDVSGRGFRVHPELQSSEPVLATQGMGLFALVRTAIDRFGGAVTFRTGTYFMSVKRARSTQDADYRVKIIVKAKSTPEFLGNMITIRLPLRRGTE